QEAIEIGWWESHLHPEDRDRVLAVQPELGKISHQILEYRFRRQDGTYFWVRDEKRMLVNEHGQVTEIVGSWSDITERVHLVQVPINGV
ncbi:MAG TPA: PAS domain-containing protein, partial [Acidobacteriota bacterium]|nr:PAS domain-containing protein [Acidobacteriota bacterium]